MELHFYNTLSRKKEKFQPIESGKVKIYTCGPTVYDFVHIGNLRAYATADLLRRALETAGFEVIHVTNITDVDDKTIKGSQSTGKDLKTFTLFFEKSYLTDISEMNVLSPTHLPHATEYINKMIEYVGKLLQSGHAYSSSDGIYFRIESFPNYGKFANLNHVSVKARIKNDEYDKESPADFALWKFKTLEDGKVSWPAPFGEGRPGWHLECSVMSTDFLGQPFDIHTGGIDLIFPHHTNEIAQSESLAGKSLANLWLHNEFVMIDGEKMSKSLGNIITLREIKDRGFNPLSLRYLFLTTHYRQKQNFTWKALGGAQNALERLVDKLAEDLSPALPKGEGDIKTPPPLEGPPAGRAGVWEGFHIKFNHAINDDLNMPQALAIVWEVVKDISLSLADKQSLIFEFDKVLGLGLQKVVTAREKEIVEIPEKVKKLVSEREELRKKGDFKKADELRKTLFDNGYIVEDVKGGSKIRKS